MKKLIAIVMMLAVIMVGCSNQHKPDKQTEELCEAQTEYCRLLKLQYNALNNEPKKANKIQQKAYCDSVVKAVSQFPKDNPFFINWVGTIKNINIRKGAKNSSIDFDIDVTTPDSIVKITFECRNIINNDSINHYPLYKDVINLVEGSKVYFTGFLGDDVLPNSLCKAFLPDEINEPFDVIEISATPLKNDILKQIIECFNLVCKVKEAIDKGEDVSKAEGNNMEQQFLSIQSGFSEKDKDIWKRIEYAFSNACNREYHFRDVE